MGNDGIAYVISLVTIGLNMLGRKAPEESLFWGERNGQMSLILITLQDVWGSARQK